MICCLCQLVKYVILTKCCSYQCMNNFIIVHSLPIMLFLPTWEICCSYQCMNNFMYSYSDVVFIRTCLKLIRTEVNGSCNRTKNCSYVYNLSISVMSSVVYPKYSNLTVEQQATKCLVTLNTYYRLYALVGFCCWYLTMSIPSMVSASHRNTSWFTHTIYDFNLKCSWLDFIVYKTTRHMHTYTYYSIL